MSEHGMSGLLAMGLGALCMLTDLAIAWVLHWWGCPWLAALAVVAIWNMNIVLVRLAEARGVFE
jgi:hypothetical protein